MQGVPFIGVRCYRSDLDIRSPDSNRITLVCCVLTWSQILKYATLKWVTSCLLCFSCSLRGDRLNALFHLHIGVNNLLLAPSQVLYKLYVLFYNVFRLVNAIIKLNIYTYTLISAISPLYWSIFTSGGRNACYLTMLMPSYKQNITIKIFHLL